MISKNSIVSKDSKIGKDVTIWHHCNIYSSTIIGNNTSIGAYTEIGGSEIGDNCKVEAFVFIPPGIKIGNNVFVGPRVTFTNDRYPKVSSFDKPEKTIVEDGVVIGASVTILPGITLHKNCLIGAGSVVTRDVPANTIVIGTPAKPIGSVDKPTDLIQM